MGDARAFYNDFSDARRAAYMRNAVRDRAILLLPACYHFVVPTCKGPVIASCDLFEDAGSFTSNSPLDAWPNMVTILTAVRSPAPGLSPVRCQYAIPTYF